MIQIFEEGYFSNNRITESRFSDVKSETKMFSSGERLTGRTTVFLSH